VKTRRTKKPRARIFALAAILLLPPLGMATWYGMSRTSDKDDQITRILIDYGYVAVTPPSRLFGPGTITTVETLPNGTLQLHLACRMNDDALAAMWQKSTTLNRRLVTDVKQTFDSSANALEVTSRTTGERIKDTDFSLQDISIVTMSDDNLIDVRSQYLKGNCEEAVIWNLRTGASVCQPEEVLEADIVYRKEFEDALGGAGTLDLAKQAAGSANITQHVSEANEVQGDHLFLGVKVRLTHCFRLAENGQHLIVGSF
jgi:hypothetical protein